MTEMEYLTGSEARKEILETFKRLHDLVVPSMGAKSMQALINDNFGRPLLTDDGVTIIKALGMGPGWHTMIAKSFIEGCHNTESAASDGTTLTALLQYHLFKRGCELIEEGEHPMIVAKKLEDLMMEVLKDITPRKMEPHLVESLANISTKIPILGKAIYDAYKKAGDQMDIVIEHKPYNKHRITVKQDAGMSIRSGYMIDELAGHLATHKGKARVALLKDGMSNQLQVLQFLSGIPAAEKHTVPTIYVVTPKFNHEVLRVLIDTSIKQNLPFQFIFLAAQDADDVYLDLAAITNARIQSTSTGIKDYTYEMCGEAKEVDIKKDRSRIIGVTEGKKRIKHYEEMLKDEKRQLTDMERFRYNFRLGSLRNGVTKIQIKAATELEFKAIYMKLTDAIGTVFHAFEEGYVLGNGKELYNLAGTKKYELISEVLKEPHRRIISNAGIEEKKYKTKADGIDVNLDKIVNLLDVGIIDSYASVKNAILNATSVATNNLKVYSIVQRKVEKKKEA